MTPRNRARTAATSGGLAVVALAGALAAGAPAGATRRGAKPSTHTLGSAKGLRFVATSRSGVARPSASATGASGGAMATGPAIACLGGCPFPPSPVGPLTHLFSRTTGDVTLRVFSEKWPVVQPMGVAASPVEAPPVGAPTVGAPGGRAITSAVLAPYCVAQREVLVEASNPGAIGTVAVPMFAASDTGITVGAFDALDSAVVGTAEGAPIEVLVAQLVPGAASVRVTFADGSTDQMAVVEGLAVLASDAATRLPATLDAYDAGGSLLSSATVSSDAAFAGPATCVGPQPPVPIPLPSSGAQGASRAVPAVSSSRAVASVGAASSGRAVTSK